MHFSQREDQTHVPSGYQPQHPHIQHLHPSSMYPRDFWNVLDAPEAETVLSRKEVVDLAEEDEDEDEDDELVGRFQAFVGIASALLLPARVALAASRAVCFPFLTCLKCLLAQYVFAASCLHVSSSATLPDQLRFSLILRNRS